MTIALGAPPLDMTVGLSPGADFVCTLRNPAGNWPIGISVELRFDDSNATVWTATVVTDQILFNVDKAEVDVLLTAKPTRARLFYLDGTTDLYWAGGKVKTYA